MKRWEAMLLHAATAAVASTGLLYAAMKYLMVGSDPDSPIHHPWQNGVLKGHLIAAPFLVFGFGLLFQRHVLPRLRSDSARGRWSGVGLLGIALPLVLSGHLVQLFVEEGARRWAGWIHAGLGLVFSLAWLAHPRGSGEKVSCEVESPFGGEAPDRG